MRKEEIFNEAKKTKSNSMFEGILKYFRDNKIEFDYKLEEELFYNERFAAVKELDDCFMYLQYSHSEFSVNNHQQVLTFSKEKETLNSLSYKCRKFVFGD